MLFEREEVEFGAGFQVLTGETGAGKSLVVDALSLLAGERAPSDLLREGSDALRVTGVFDLPQGFRERLCAHGIEAEGEELVVRRDLTREGRSRAFVNDAPVTLRTLQSLVRERLRIHGQREELGLLVPGHQRELVDRAGGSIARKLLAEVAEAYTAWRELAREAERARAELERREDRLDEIREALTAIDQVAPEVGEEIRWKEERERLRHAEALTQTLALALEAMTEGEGSASERLFQAERKLVEAKAWEPESEGWARELRGLRTGLEEVARAVHASLHRLEVNPHRLDWIEERLLRLERLIRRFGPDTSAVLAARHALVRELEMLEAGEPAARRLAEAEAAAQCRYRELALELSHRRREWAKELAQRAETELGELGLGHARIEVAVAEREDRSGEIELNGRRIACGPWGWDEVEILWQPNPGEGVVPLARSASGGELSRISLALLLASGDESLSHPPTLVFDEIDAGLGGSQGAALGRKMRRLSERYQVLAVTHLPQVACFAHRHLRVAKRVGQVRTRAVVELLFDRARQQEIARMLAADAVTPLALEHAAELLAEASKSD